MSTSNFYTKLYALVRRSGLPGTSPESSLFRRAYFAYKMFVEDPFYMLVRNHPEYFRGGDIIDVGANIGYCTWIFQKACDTDSTVHSFEPAPDNFAQLKKYFSNNPKIELHHACVSEKEGTATLWINEDHHADNRTLTDDYGADLNQKECIQVPSHALDSYAQERGITVAFIKIDVQGVEELVFRGMTEVIERDTPHVVFEYCPSQVLESGFQPDFLINFFIERDYELFQVSKKGTLAPISHAKLKEHEKDAGFYTDILATKTALAA